MHHGCTFIQWLMCDDEIVVVCPCDGGCAAISAAVMFAHSTVSAVLSSVRNDVC